MSLDILNVVLTLGFIGMTAAGVYSVWQSFHIDINHKAHKSHLSK